MENYVGKRLDGRYEIIEVLGVGGMAVVYKAYDNIDRRIVAVKILKDEYISNEDFRRRFKNESKAIAVLSHPNIVKVYDVSYGDLLQYIVMEYVDGITLKKYIEQQGVVDAKEAVYFVTQILRALQHAHDNGIVHRDVKPQNIMLISDGTIKVTDFGIARMSRSETKTMSGEAIGSVHYISPEQVKGSVTDARSDIYSVGVALYEMLTGKLPFDSNNTAQLILMQIQKPPVMPSAINPSIPAGLEQIIIRAMQKNPNDRYQTASEMLADIEKYKKNPNVRFDYSYLVDKTSTRYVDPKNAQTAQRSDVQQRPAQRTPNTAKPTAEQMARYEKELEIEEKKSKKTIGALVGVAAVLVIIAIVIVSFVFPNKDKVKVPSLVGLNYTNDVLNNDDYSVFNFELQSDTESSADPGTIVKQTPESGKIKRGGTIVLFVASSGSQTEVPDVYGYEFASAQATLKSRNFSVKVVKEKNDSVSLGEVIRTSPAKGEMAETGSVVTIFVSSSGEAEKVDVPSLIDMTIDEAKEALEKVGLELDSARTEYRPSSKKRGTVIGHEGLGEQLEVGTAVAVYVSSGREAEEKTTAESTTESQTTTKRPESTTEKTTKAPKPTEKPTVPKTTKPTEPPTSAPKTTHEETTEQREEQTTKKPVTTEANDEPNLE